MDIIIQIFEWLNSQLLRMDWLKSIVYGFFEKTLHLDPSDRWVSSGEFFLFDTIKIFILLMVLIFIVSYIQSYFPPERTKLLLGHMTGLKGNFFGALLGILTPFCSCSSIPIFIGFVSAGLPLGVVFSFLIASPLVDLAAFFVLASGDGLGFPIAISYVIVGVLLAVFGGWLIERLKLEKYIQDYVLDIRNNQKEINHSFDFKLKRKERATYAVQQVKDIIKRVWLYILIGVGIGAAIHRWIPETYIQWILGKNNPFSVLIASLVGIPMYSDIFGAIPIAEELYKKGVGIGTILSFMMAVTALSLPSMVMLSKVVKRKLLIIFISIVTIGIILIGYLFNYYGYLFM